PRLGTAPAPTTFKFITPGCAVPPAKTVIKVDPVAPTAVTFRTNAVAVVGMPATPADGVAVSVTLYDSTEPAPRAPAAIGVAFVHSPAVEEVRVSNIRHGLP